MFFYPEFDEGGVKQLCRRGKLNPAMNMNIYVIRLEAGETFCITDGECETAVLLLQGEIKLTAGGRSASGKRQSPFEHKPLAVHAPKNTDIIIDAIADSEIIIQQTDNPAAFDVHFYTEENTLYQEFGKGQWDGAGHRVVSTFFDPDNAPYSNMVMGEVYTKPGKWSSYPPHHHPQPEVYYYRFDKPQGFGACFLGDNVYKSKDGSFCCIEPGDDHEQAAAPGYEMYYVWMIRHNDGDPWYKTTRIVGEEHKWLLDK